MRTYEKIKRILFVVIGVLALLYYGVCIAFAHIGVSWLWIWPLLACFCFVRAFMLKKNIHPPGWLAFIYRLLLALFVAVFAIVECKIVKAMNTRPEQNLDYIITLGAAVRDGEPTSPLVLRIDRTYAYMLENPHTIDIASGGQGENESMSEAVCIKKYLVEYGMNPDRILLEDKSTDTEENIANSFQMIPEGKRTGIVTSSFHIYRALAVARLQGYEAYAVPAYTYPILGVHYVVREFFAVMELWAQQIPNMNVRPSAGAVS